jgi:hypothetical protein
MSATDQGEPGRTQQAGHLSHDAGTGDDGIYDRLISLGLSRVCVTEGDRSVIPVEDPDKPIWSDDPRSLLDDG